MFGNHNKVKNDKLKFIANFRLDMFLQIVISAFVYSWFSLSHTQNDVAAPADKTINK